MTSQEVVNVVYVMLEYLESQGLLVAVDEQAILDLYYSKYGMYEQDWQEIAESIR